MGTPQVSVVAATHNRAERLSALLDGLRRQTLPAADFEVVIVDDASSDATPELLERERGRGDLRLTVVRNELASGPAVARNRGWRLANAPRVAFTDDDCVPAVAWLESLLAAAKGRPEAIVTGMTLPAPSEAGASGPYAKTVRVTGPSPHYETCNVAYSRELLERVGGFDESYGQGAGRRGRRLSPAGEDSDLGCRAAAAGGRQVFAPEALVHHAVFARGPLSALRDALVATDDIQAYKQNPELRRHLPAGVFYGRTHQLLLAALAGGLIARHHRAGALLALPYARDVLQRCRASGATRAQAPYFVGFDLLQMVAAMRGAVRHRVPII